MVLITLTIFNWNYYQLRYGFKKPITYEVSEDGMAYDASPEDIKKFQLLTYEIEDIKLTDFYFKKNRNEVHFGLYYNKSDYRSIESFYIELKDELGNVYNKGSGLITEGLFQSFFTNYLKDIDMNNIKFLEIYITPIKRTKSGEKVQLRTIKKVIYKTQNL